MTVAALRMVEREARVYRRTWRGSAISGLIEPVFFLAAMGLGLGGLVRSGAGSVEGVDYIDFLAPGLLAASLMQTAIGESTWPVLAAIKWAKTYDAILATPIRVVDLLVGRIAWIAIRLGLSALAFFLVAIPFGVWHSPLAVLVVPVAMLTGLAFAIPVHGYAATIEQDSGFVLLYRLGIIPLFLFSGTFFPISQLPGGLQAVAKVTPLWHGVALCRDLALGRAEWAPSLLHLGYVLLVIAVTFAYALRAFTRRLTR